MSNLSRRTLVTGAASVAAVPAMSAVPAAADDTLARIQEHRTVASKIIQMLRRQEKLEKAIPGDRRLSGSIADRGTDVGANDDPRWTEFQSEYWALEDRIDEISWSFVDRPPSCLAGAQALLSYVGEYEACFAWPDARHHFEDDGRYAGCIPEDWRSSLMEAISHTLAHAA